MKCRGCKKEFKQKEGEVVCNKCLEIIKRIRDLYLKAKQCLSI